MLLIATPFLSAFDFSRRNIPLADIESGGPLKDGIPAVIAHGFPWAAFHPETPLYTHPEVPSCLASAGTNIPRNRQCIPALRK